MGLFKKQIKFVSAICPECKGHLELDSSLTKAFCQYCGAQCVVENAPKNAKKRSGLETVLEFVERQQDLRRQDRRERERAEEERERAMEESDREQRENLRKYWYIYLISGLVFFGCIITMLILSKQGII